MKRFLSLALAGLLLFPSCHSEKPVTPTDRPNAAVEEGISRFEAWAEDPASLPVAFIYDGQEHQGLAGLELLLDTPKSSAVWHILPQ